MTVRTRRSLSVVLAAAFAGGAALAGVGVSAQAPSPPPLPLPSTSPAAGAPGPVPSTLLSPTPLPVVTIPPTGGRGRRKGWKASDSRWVRPELVAQVQFTEWTDDGILRHPSFQGLRIDKNPRDVVRE